MLTQGMADRERGRETRTSTDDGSMELSEGVRTIIPLRETKMCEKRRRENKKCLQGTGLAMSNGKE